MKKLTIESATTLLKKLESSLPKLFKVLSVAFLKKTNTYYIKCIDELKKKAYNNKMA